MYLIYNNKKASIKIYDIEGHFSFDKTIKLKINFNISGFSQINSTNELYIIGLSSFESLNIESSFIFKFAPNEDQSNLITLINSLFPHYKPVLVEYNRIYIMVIGGNFSNKVEIYNKQLNHWRFLPDLPEIISNGTALYNNYNELMYLFGANNNNIYVLDMKEIIQWSLLSITTPNNCNLSKQSMGAVLIDNMIFLLGGSSNSQKSNEIVQIDINTNEIVENNSQLLKACTFELTQSINVDNNSFYLLDDQLTVFSIERSNYCVNQFDI